LESLLGEIQTLQPPLAVTAFQANKILNELTQLNFDIERQYEILGSWNSIMRDVDRFVQSGSQNAIEEGAVNTKFYGDYHSSTFAHQEECSEEFPKDCTVRGRFEFDVDKTNSRGRD